MSDRADLSTLYRMTEGLTSLHFADVPSAPDTDPGYIASAKRLWVVATRTAANREPARRRPAGTLPRFLGNDMLR